MAGETVSHVRLIDDQATQRTGNVFIEIDTGLTYFYDEEEEDWILPGASAETTAESAGD